MNYNCPCCGRPHMHGTCRLDHGIFDKLVRGTLVDFKGTTTCRLCGTTFSFISKVDKYRLLYGGIVFYDIIHKKDTIDKIKGTLVV